MKEKSSGIGVEISPVNGLSSSAPDIAAHRDAAVASKCGDCASTCGDHSMADMPIPLGKRGGPGDGKKVYVFSNGCVENQMDHSRLQKYFQSNGWDSVADYKQADLVVFNTCAVDQKMEDASVAKIEEFQAQAEADLIVGGCLPKINRKRMHEVHDGPSFGPRTMNKLDSIIEAEVSMKDVRVNQVEKTLGHGDWLHRLVGEAVEVTAMVDEQLQLGLMPLFRKFGVNWYSTKMFYLDLGVGCLSHCSFCAIKHAKGNVESTSPEDVVAQFRDGLSQGFREFVLSSDDCGSYGRDLGTDLVELLRKLIHVEGDYKIHVRYVEPSRLLEIIDGLVDLLQSTDKIVSLTSSIQSGNNRVLHAMNKEIQIEDWIRCIQELNTRAPHVSVRTQVITGFPGETEAEFQDTLRLFDLLDLDSSGVYAYSDRPHTRASRMDGKLPEDLKNRRRKQVLRKMIYRRMRRSVVRMASDLRQRLPV
jgi:tRNA A37 methylthiotransferase MiaB